MKRGSRDATEWTVEVLLADHVRAAAATGRLAETRGWPETVALAREWKVAPQLMARVTSLGLQMPGDAMGELRREFLRVYAQSTSRAAKAILAIQALEDAGMAVAAFKGVASMAVLYGGPKQRTIGDGDLLVLRKDLPGAIACLERIGFARRGEETLAEYLAFVENAPRFAGNEAIALYGEDGSEIDVHWAIAGSGLRVDEVLKRSVRAELMGSSIPVVDAKDGWLLAVHHAIREDLAIESVCRDLLDVRLWCEWLEAAGELEAGVRLAAESGSVVTALAVTGLLKSYDETTAAARTAELLRGVASRAERGSSARLMELFQYQLRHGRFEKDVMLLVHARPWRQIARGLTTDWSGYRRSMKTLEVQLGDELPLRKRLVLVTRSIPGLRGLRLARGLARVKYKSR